MWSTSENPNERDRMLIFAVQWMPYGGGNDEDIMVTFGTTPSTYYRRLEHLLADAGSPVDLDARTREALLRMCRRRLDAATERVEVGQ